MELHNLFRNADDIVDFPAGTVIFTEGSPGDQMYVVLEGEVEVRAGGRVVEIIQAGAVLGEMALIDSQPRSATATAQTACRLAPVNERRFLFLVQETPFFALHIMRLLATRLRNMNARGVC